MEAVVFALASNEAYFPGLYCAVASALGHLDPKRRVDVKVLDGGMSSVCKDALSRLIQSLRGHADLQFVPVDDSLFYDATLGPGESHMAYCRILLPQLLDVPRLIYLDSDVLVFRDLAKLFDFQLPLGKAIAAVRDSETLSLADDSRAIAHAMNLPVDGAYFNSGVMFLNLDQLRKEGFAEQCLDFFRHWKGRYQFHDQSAINFLLHDRIAELPEYWNRPYWRFDEQTNNDLECVLHYTRSAPWLGGTPGPAQNLFERFASEVGLPVNRRPPAFKKSIRQMFWRNVAAPLRALTFPVASSLYRIAGHKDRAAAYQKAARYWFDYIRDAPSRRQLHRQRSREISRMKFDLHASALVP